MGKCSMTMGNIKMEVIARRSDEVGPDGRAFTKEALEEQAAKNPSKLFTRVAEDGKTELVVRTNLLEVTLMNAYIKGI